MSESSQSQRIYLLQEAGAFLLVSYIILLGGTFNGLVRTDIRLISLLLVSGIGFVWLVWRVIRKKNFPLSGFDLQIVLFIVAYILATVLSSDPRRSAMLLGQIILYGLLFYIILELRRSGWPLEVFVKAFLVVSCFVIFFGLLEVITWLTSWWELSGAESIVPPTTIRIRAFLGHPNFAAAFLNLVLPLGVVQFYKTKSKLWRILLSVWILLVILLLYFTSSRGGWIGAVTVLTSLALLLYLDSDSSLGDTLRKYFWSVVGVLLLSALILIPSDGGGSRQAQHPTHGTGFGSRSAIWGVALDSFKQDPVSGIGPYLYGSEFIQGGSVPPGMLLAHAHNVVFNIAAEAGIIGVLAFGILVISILREAWLHWQSQRKGDRTWLAALLASLTGFALHSMFDTPGTLPAISMIAVILVAWIPREHQQTNTSRGKWLGNALIGAGWVIILIMMWFGLNAYKPLLDGLRAGANEEWTTAASLADEAVSRDPSFAYYWFQAGFAKGKIALDAFGEVEDPENLQAAIRAYETGLSMDASYAVNWANLAQLNWAGGDPSAAIENLSHATDIAPNQPNFQLTLGFMHERVGNLDASETAYRKALQLDANIADTSFFHETSFRLTLLDEFLSQEKARKLSNPSQTIAAWLAIENADYDRAIDLFEGMDQLNDPGVNLGRGLAYLGKGEFDPAREHLNLAVYIAGNEGWIAVRIKNALGIVFAREADCEVAIAMLEGVSQSISHSTSSGYATGGSTDYAWYIYNREALPGDLLPGFVQSPYTSEILSGMRELARCYQEVEQFDAAEKVFDELRRVSKE
jgi:tetratricopeptide (TPR) repeat protein/O-antigen ligase